MAARPPVSDARRMEHDPRFRDRVDAGRQLAPLLEGERGPGTVVVGLPRGGVPVAAEVARALGAPLDVVAVRKVGHPWQPEYAIGAVTSGGGLVLRGRDGLTEEEVERAVTGARLRAEGLDRELRRGRPAPDLAGRTVVLVDDGLATGATMLAAVRWARAQQAGRVVVAVPVGAASSVRALAAEADAVVCPYALRDFGAVGYWYADFGQVATAEVLRLLDEAG